MRAIRSSSDSSSQEYGGWPVSVAAVYVITPCSEQNSSGCSLTKAMRQSSCFYVVSRSLGREDIPMDLAMGESLWECTR